MNKLHRPPKRLLSNLLCLALVLSLVPAFGLTAAAAGPTTIYSTSFEDASQIKGWTSLDSDGDGFDWETLDFEETGIVPDGLCCAVSYSYDPDTGDDLTPDNWLYSPEIEIPATGKTKLSYSVFALDPAWYNEIYHVYVLEGSSITRIWSEDLKEGEDIDNPASRTLDLSAYAGKTINIAFQHFGSSGQFAIGLDKVEIYNEPPALTSIDQVAVVVTAPVLGAPVKSDARVAAGTSGYALASAQWETTDILFRPWVAYSLVVTLETTGERSFGEEVRPYVNGHQATIITRSDTELKFYYAFPMLEDTVTACPKDATCPCAQFSDVDPKQWYHDGIHYCVENGLMNGVGDGRFDPGGDSSRAMLVTVLWRQAGSPKMGTNSFTDVPSGQWYTDAVTWAAANKIVQGADGKFRPMDPISRQEFAIIMYNYAGYCGIDVTGRADLTPFADDETVAAWARPQMEWAVANGLINGIDGNRLDPTGKAVRAQMATILYRFSNLPG